nr:MAG TPA: hypothetical protein [Caudoviricetes sp.]
MSSTFLTFFHFFYKKIKAIPLDIALNMNNKTLSPFSRRIYYSIDFQKLQ